MPKNAGIAILLVLFTSLSAQAAGRSNPMLHQQGTKIVDGHGREVKLRGVNLGGWLLWEGWIFGKGMLTSETTILTRLEKAVGVQEAEGIPQRSTTISSPKPTSRKSLGPGSICPGAAASSAFRRRPRLEILGSAAWLVRETSCLCRAGLARRSWRAVRSWAWPIRAMPVIWSGFRRRIRKKTVAIWKSIAARYRKRQDHRRIRSHQRARASLGRSPCRLYRRIIRAIRAEDPDHLIFLEGGSSPRTFPCSTSRSAIIRHSAFTCTPGSGTTASRSMAAYRDLARKQNATLWWGIRPEFLRYDPLDGRDVRPLPGDQRLGLLDFLKRRRPAAPGLMTIKLPKDWEKRHGVGRQPFGGEPQPATIRAGIRSFSEAMKLKNCEYDLRMERALLPKTDDH